MAHLQDHIGRPLQRERRPSGRGVALDSAISQAGMSRRRHFARDKDRESKLRRLIVPGVYHKGVPLERQKLRRHIERFTVKNVKVMGPNIIPFQLSMRKEEQWHVVGCYSPLLR